MKAITIQQLLDYLSQFSSSTKIYPTLADVEEPGEFLTFDSIVQQFSD